MKRAILTLSAAILLLASAPAQADGNRSRHDGYRQDRRHEQHARPSHRFEPRHFRDHRRGYYVLPPYFGVLVYPPRLGSRYYDGYDRPRFRRHGGPRFDRHDFRDRRYRH